MASMLIKKIKDFNKEKAKLIEEVREIAEDKLEDVKKLFGSYTDHSIKHSERVLWALENLLIGKERLEKAKWDGEKLRIDKDCYLTFDEIVLLVLGAYLHDIGMSPKVDHPLNSEARRILKNLREGRGDRVKLKNRLEELREKIREKHHEISAWFVENNEEIEDVLEKLEIDKGVLADIVKGHRMDISEIFEMRSVGDVRVSLLAFLLQLADELDIGFERVKNLVEKRHEVEEESLKHILSNMKAKRGKRVGGEIVYFIRLRDFRDNEANRKALRLLVRWNGKIERLIDGAKLFGGDVIRDWREVLPSKVVFKVETKEYDFDLSKRFEVDRELFAKTLSSDIYGNNWKYAFRELITNCFDAIKRRWIEDKDFGNPRVLIDVELDENGYLITIDDNGIGMDRAEVEDYLLTVGRSIYREKRERGEEIIKKISAVGYFGIGFLSSFMLAMDDDGKFVGWIEVETKKVKEKRGVRVEIIDPNLPLVIGWSDKDSFGTRIRIKGKRRDVREFFEKTLKVKSFSFEIWGIVSSVFESLGLEIPIEVKVNKKVIWKDVVKPEFFMEGEKVEEVEFGGCRLEVWKGGIDKIINVNGIKCDNTNDFNKQFDVLLRSKIDGEMVGFVLNIERNDVRFLNLEKRVVEIPKEIVGGLFRGLEKKRIILDLYDYDLFLNCKDKDFEKIGAMGFVRKCLRFEGLYGEFKSLEEIEKEGKKPILVDIEFFEIFYDEFKDFWERKGWYPLINFSFLTTCQKISDFFERCKVCDNCVFDKGLVIKIKDKDLRKLLFERFGNIVAIHLSGRLVSRFFILDNPFVKGICEEWRNGNKEIKKLVRKIMEIIKEKVSEKGYMTVEDVEEVVWDDVKLKTLYERIKFRMGDLNGVSRP